MDVQEVVQEFKEVATEVTAEGEEIAVEVEEVVKAATVGITDAEKFAVRDLENAFLKANLELKRLQEEVKKHQDTITDAQKKFPAMIEGYAKRLGISITEYVFDAVDLLFKRK
jgi:uncharacterized protein YpuA (DUF1002 family)